MAAKKASGRKYGPKAQSSVEREMKAFKKGKLKSGSGRKVKNPKQAIAIGLSEARRSGAKVPPPPSRSASAKKKSSAKKSSAKKSSAKKSSARRSPAKKTASKKSPRKSSAKKSSGRKSSGRKSSSKKSSTRSR